MANKLTPNTIYIINGVTVNEKIIPDGTTWTNSVNAKKDGFTVGALYKKQAKLTKGSGKPLTITIHNTNDLPNVEDDAEQYIRATFNENMRTSRVHYYVDDLGAWQNLKAGTGKSKNDPEGSAEVGWHAGDGNDSNGGNMTSLSVEIIMNDTPEHDQKAGDNGARIVAWLLKKHGLTIEDLRTHTFWVNRSKGNEFGDIDKQCTSPVKSGKWCPAYILGNTVSAFSNWKAFKQLVLKYYTTTNLGVDAEDSQNEIDSNATETIVTGNLVRIKKGAKYYSGKTIPSWVIAQNWYVKSIAGDRAVIDINENRTNSICSPVNVMYLQPVAKGETVSAFKPYRVRSVVGCLNIRSGPGVNYRIVGSISETGVYTIITESYGNGASKWGKLKSGAGWISLDYIIRV